MSKQSSDSPIPSRPLTGMSVNVIDFIFFLIVLFGGRFLCLFVTFAMNGGAGGSSELSSRASTALIVCGVIYLLTVFFTARLAFRSCKTLWAAPVKSARGQKEHWPRMSDSVSNGKLVTSPPQRGACYRNVSFGSFSPGCQNFASVRYPYKSRRSRKLPLRNGSRIS